jgi:hypothetical protein
LDADPIKLFPGAIDLMNPQNPCPRCGRSGFGREDVTSGRHCPLSAPGTFRTSLLELMMSVHWVKADIAIASVEI